MSHRKGIPTLTAETLLKSSKVKKDQKDLEQKAPE
jgi:hypothetical protein